MVNKSPQRREIPAFFSGRRAGQQLVLCRHASSTLQGKRLRFILWRRRRHRLHWWRWCWRCSRQSIVARGASNSRLPHPCPRSSRTVSSTMWSRSTGPGASPRSSRTRTWFWRSTGCRRRRCRWFSACPPVGIRRVVRAIRRLRRWSFSTVGSRGWRETTAGPWICGHGRVGRWRWTFRSRNQYGRSWWVGSCSRINRANRQNT